MMTSRVIVALLILTACKVVLAKHENCEHENKSLANYAGGERVARTNIVVAQTKCKADPECKGLTFEPDRHEWSLRSSDVLKDSTIGEKSMLKRCFARKTPTIKDDKNNEENIQRNDLHSTTVLKTPSLENSNTGSSTTAQPTKDPDMGNNGNSVLPGSSVFKHNLQITVYFILLFIYF